MRASMKPFWNNKRVLVTGHTGFKGGWLCVLLNHLGAEVHGYSLDAPSTPSFFDVCGVSSIVDSVKGDVTDLKHLNEVFKRVQPDIVLHLAAQAIVRKSYVQPVETLNTNIMGSVNVLEACRLTQSVKAVVMVTSDKCYENNEWVWGYRENDPMGGYDPYSCSKGCAELVTAAYRNSFFNQRELGEEVAAIASVRAGNVIGGGDWAEDRLIPDLVKAIISNKTLAIRSPNATRPWQHVLEPLHGYLIVAENLFNNRDQYAEAWNFGPTDDGCMTVQWVVTNFKKAWDTDTDWMQDTGENPHESSFLKLDISKAQARLGWRPRWTIEQALAATAEWYRVWHNGENMHEFSKKQIAEYRDGV